MAIIKRRIMSKARLLTLMHADIDRKDIGDHTSQKNMAADIFAYMIADGNEVRIFHDVQMGGMVVEYDDGN